MLTPSLETIVWKFVGPSKTAAIISESKVIAKNVKKFLVCGPRFKYGGKLRMYFSWDGTQKLFDGPPIFRFHAYTKHSTRSLTQREYGNICFLGKFTYKAHVPYECPDIPSLTLEKTFITVKDVERWIQHCESIGRFLPGNGWFDEVDTSHTYFEGIKKKTDGSWSAAWGS